MFRKLKNPIIELFLFKILTSEGLDWYIRVYVTSFVHRIERKGKEISYFFIRRSLENADTWCTAAMNMSRMVTLSEK